MIQNVGLTGLEPITEGLKIFHVTITPTSNIIFARPVGFEPTSSEFGVQGFDAIKLRTHIKIRVQ